MKRTTINHAQSLGEALGQDHAALERTFERVIAKFNGGDAEDIRAAWEQLDAELSAHLAAEERLIIPRFRRDDPEAADRILDEHRSIRAALEMLGVDLDLHSLRAEAAAGFIAALRRHAAYEDLVLYPWADAHLTEEERLFVFKRLRALVHAKDAVASAPC